MDSILLDPYLCRPPYTTNDLFDRSINGRDRTSQPQ